MTHSDQRLSALGVVHGCSTTEDGDMKDPALRARLLSSVGANPDRLLCLKQTHSDIIVHAADEAAALGLRNSPYPEADAWILSASGWGAAIFTADCVPVLIWDASASMLGAAHAGWRGAAKKLPAKTAARMLELGAKAPLRAWIGPHIRPCCFEVGPELREHFPAQAFSERQGKIYLDLELSIRVQLQEAGLDDSDIRSAGLCTHCGENLFSYRKNPHCGRLMTYIFKK
ncbi:MAG: laccase domain-containing protein [Elusimicrobia bacterium]|nr:laccase domain-containing protein [Elusimicrobiota bacterium]